MEILKIGREAYYRIDGERIKVLLPLFQVEQDRPKTKILWRAFDLPYCGKKGDAVVIWNGETLYAPLEITLKEEEGRAYFEVREFKEGRVLKFPAHSFASLGGLIEDAVEIFREAENLDEMEEWDEDLLF